MIDHILSSICNVGLSVLANKITPSVSVKEQMDKCYKKALKEVYPYWSTDNATFYRYKDLDALSKFIKGNVSKLTPEHLLILPVWIEKMKDDAICSEYVRDVENKGLLDNIDQQIKDLTQVLTSKIDLLARQESERHREIVDKLDRQDDMLKLIQKGVQQQGLKLQYDVDNEVVWVGKMLIHFDDLSENIHTNRELEFYINKYKQEPEFKIKNIIGKEIDNILLNIINTTEAFKVGGLDFTHSQRLSKANDRIEQGDYTGADNVLDEREIKLDESKLTSTLEKVSESIVRIASEWHVKAKTVMSNDSLQMPDRINNAYRYYDYAIANLDKIPCSEYVMKIKSQYLFDFALFAQRNNNFTLAEEKYALAIGVYRQLAKANPSAYQSDVAMTLNNLANLHKDTGRLKEAEKEYEEALGIRRKLTEANPSAYLPDMATTLNNLAVLHSDTGRLEEAEKEYREALGIYRKLAEANPSAYLPYVATTLNNLANLHSDTGRLEEAEKEYEEALGIRRKLAETNPSAYLPDVATTLNNLAVLHSDTGRLEEAEEEYKEALDLRRGLAAKYPSVYDRDLANTLECMVELHEKAGRFTEAETERREANELRSKK